MFLLGYFEDGTPVMGLPSCVMHAGATVFDLMLPKIAADVPVTRADIAALGEGGAAFRFGADIPVLEFLTERRGLFRDGVLKLMISRIRLNFPS